MENYYQILGITSTASDDEIKKAYRKLALKHHPDRNQGNPESLEKFKLIQKSYETLSNKSKRRAYDYRLFYKPPPVIKTPPRRPSTQATKPKTYYVRKKVKREETFLEKNYDKIFAFLLISSVIFFLISPISYVPTFLILPIYVLGYQCYISYADNENKIVYLFLSYFFFTICIIGYTSSLYLAIFCEPLP